MGADVMAPPAPFSMEDDCTGPDRTDVRVNLHTFAGNIYSTQSHVKRDLVNGNPSGIAQSKA